jgi:DNA repair photolyase
MIGKMIISASRRTDIPAFLGEWFIKRIKAGYFYRINPFNSKQVTGFSLLPEDVDVIVFWTKNPSPFLKHLDILDKKGYKYYFQFTLNDYPALFEPTQNPLEERIATFKALSSRLGRQRVIWRYDPIIISTVTTMEYHLDRISNIAQKLNGYTDRLIISFLDLYGKVKHRLRKIETEYSLKLEDLTLSINRQQVLTLSKTISHIARLNDMAVYSCAEGIDLQESGIFHGSCIDAKLIKRLFNVSKDFSKDKNQRSECLCAESIDVGAYNTCKGGCSYCYANSGAGLIKSNANKHIEDNPCLIGTFHQEIEIMKDKKTLGSGEKQLSMFKSDAE